MQTDLFVLTSVGVTGVLLVIADWGKEERG